MTDRDLMRFRRRTLLVSVAPLCLALVVPMGQTAAAQIAASSTDTLQRAVAPPPAGLPLSSARAMGESTQPPPLLTLDTAVALALRVATPVQQARFASANARTEVGRSYLGIVPSVTVSGIRSFTQGNPLVSATATEPWNTQIEVMGFQVQTSLNLLGAMSVYPGIRSADYVRQTLDLSLERTRQAVALDVSQAFLQTVLDSELVVIAAENLSVSQEQVVQLGELVRVGKRPPADLYQAQAQASANQSVLFDAINRQRADQIALLQRVHIDPQRSVVIAPPPLDTTLLARAYLDTARVADDALRRRPDLQSAHAAIHATRWGIRRAENENMPELVLGVGAYSAGRVFDYAYQDGVPQITTPQSSLSAQVGSQGTWIFSAGISYSLFDALRSNFDVQEAQVAFGSAEVAEGDVRREVTGDVARAISEYGVSVQRMASTASGLAAAEAAFQLVSGRYNVGFASIVDLLAAQAALAQAQSLRAEAVVQLSLSKRALAYAMGLQPTDRLP